MAFGLQSILMFCFFSFLCLSLNIQSITLAQCMSPKILQGFHGLGRRVEQLAWQSSLELSPHEQATLPATVLPT